MTIFALFLTLSNWNWSPASCKGLHIPTAEVIPFSFQPAVLPFNLAALKNWVRATTKRLDLAFCFISASYDPQGGLSELVCTAWRWEIVPGLCLFGFLPPPHRAEICLTVRQAPQELPSDKMSPWLCSMRPICWPDALYTWESDSQSTEQELVWRRGGIQSCSFLLHVTQPYFVNCLPFYLHWPNQLWWTIRLEVLTSEPHD